MFELTSESYATELHRGIIGSLLLVFIHGWGLYIEKYVYFLIEVHWKQTIFIFLTSEQHSLASKEKVPAQYFSNYRLKVPLKQQTFILYFQMYFKLCAQGWFLDSNKGNLLKTNHVVQWFLQLFTVCTTWENMELSKWQHDLKIWRSGG